MAEKIGKFIGVGVGPGDPELITLKAVRVLQEADVIFEAASSFDSVANKATALVGDCEAERHTLVFSMAPKMEDRKAAWKEGAAKVAVELKKGKNCVFTTIGDPLIYSTYTYLLKEVRLLVPDVEVETVPGITSFQAAASKKSLPLVEDKEVLTLIPAWTEETINDHAIAGADTLVLLKTYKKRKEIKSILEDKGFLKKGIYAARLGLERELVSNEVERLTDFPEEYLSLLVTKK